MIFVKGYGQMCNNILQYAHVYAWGKENGQIVVSMRFAYKYKYFALCKERYHNPITYLVIKFLLKLRLIKYYLFQEPNDLSSNVLNELQKKRVSVIDGWEFRFPALFLKYKEDIKQLFKIEDKIFNKTKEYLESKASENEICLGLHIRRGDYRKWMGGKYMYDDDTYAYYVKQFIKLNIGKKVNVFISTNDNKFDIELFKEKVGSKYIYFFNKNSIYDLCLLSLCDYIIGPKSTFSLVASFYRDIPIFWIEKPKEEISLESFKNFDNLFMYA